jgi:hypothetical protein
LAILAVTVVGVLEPYEAALAGARARFGTGRFARSLLAGDLSPSTIERFLLWFAALGVQMTRPVPDWIRRAGARCDEAGFEAVGAALVEHARHEEGHDTLFANDARALAARWNAHRSPRVDAERLLAHPPTAGMCGYMALHERTIAGPAPYAQLAIEYEIEQLSVAWGPRFLAVAGDVLGGDVETCMTFAIDHVRLDVGHTHWNRVQLGRLLGSRPDVMDALVEAGSEALDAYAAFLDDCIDLATRAADAA